MYLRQVGIQQTGSSSGVHETLGYTMELNGQNEDETADGTWHIITHSICSFSHHHLHCRAHDTYGIKKWFLPLRFCFSQLDNITKFYHVAFITVVAINCTQTRPLIAVIVISQCSSCRFFPV